MPSVKSAGDSRYQPLLEFLAAAMEDEVRFTYRELSELLGEPLPATAVLSAGWWNAKRTAHVQAWTALGWKANASAAKRVVVFHRVAEASDESPG